MRDWVNPANALTSGNLVAGFLALILTAQGDYAWAAGSVVVAAAFDTVDGMAARSGGGSSENDGFGSNLDSLADLLSFGAAPAMLLYLSLLHEVPILGIAACLGFVLCGAWRLARFPLVSRTRSFVGLPIPPSGVAAALVAALQPSLEVATSITVGLCVLMVSIVPFPTFFPSRRERHAAEMDLELDEPAPVVSE
jgi:CDP-diacylglycerol--serine O-phosphatidyltransferase